MENETDCILSTLSSVRYSLASNLAKRQMCNLLDFGQAVTMTIEIELTQGYVALVDPIDADLADFVWYPLTSRGRTYARRNVYVDGKQKQELLHRTVLARLINRPLLVSEEVDHIDNDSLNNRRSNLRVATRAENCRNRKRRSDNTSGYKGVSYDKSKGVWSASICVNKALHIGYFHTAVDAAIAYNQAALRYFGEFALFNDIPNWKNLNPQCALRSPKSGYKGVHSNGKRWGARIRINKQLIYLGTFDTPEIAHEAYCKAAVELRGEFARTE